MNLVTPASRLASIALLALVAALGAPVVAQDLQVPETPIDQVPEGQRAAAQRARMGIFVEYRKLVIARAEAALALQAFRKSLRGKEQTEADLAKIATMDAEVSKAGDRLDSWTEGKELTADDYAAMDYINQEVTRAALAWAKKNQG
ncbi:MAG: hypothetical protein O2819_05540 [Planctomycetota bacterium]|nr:hypothetical protein [Planctomycetota bacterium]MDA1106349.1 hypothetical protein [Planctomycetota bacterium]